MQFSGWGFQQSNTLLRSMVCLCFYMLRAVHGKFYRPIELYLCQMIIFMLNKIHLSASNPLALYIEVTGFSLTYTMFPDFQFSMET